MLEQAQKNLGSRHSFRFQVLDAQQIPLPFGDASFGAVIANHMLYYVADKPALFAEIRRVLKPGGRFYATTVGERHLAEMEELVTRFDASLATWGDGTESFTLENGAEQMAGYFPDVTLERYEDGLAVTEVEPLLAYILSSKLGLEEERISQLKAFLEGEMEKSGVLRITKDFGDLQSAPVKPHFLPFGFYPARWSTKRADSFVVRS